METLIETPTPRGEPSDVAARLREVDPATTLVYLGLGQWLLGSVQPHAYRRQLADRLIANQFRLPVEERRPGVVVWGRMLRAGLRAIALYTEEEVNSGYAVLDFRRREWNWRNRPDEAFEETLARVSDERDIEERIVTILDAVHSEWRSVYRWAFRGQRSIINPGLN